MENRKIVVKYCLSQKGQKAEILAGRSGEMKRTGEIIVDEEILSSPYVLVGKDEELLINNNYPLQGWLCGFGGYYISASQNNYFVAERKLDTYVSDKVLSDEEITEIYRHAIVKKYAQMEVEAYNLRIEAEEENKRRCTLKTIEKLHAEGKLYYRNEKGQFDKV